MSNFSKMLMQNRTNQQVVAPEPLRKCMEITTEWEPNRVPNANVYTVGVTIQARACISDADLKREVGRYVIRDTKRHIVEAVFGEFRLPISTLRQAIFMGDLNEARRLLKELELQMFSIDDAEERQA